ncbi:MAG: DUF4145 domain-containing protein [Prosthecobacter sp.]|uniref:DUF4145 domain-containing protein n=1 Tax=Prosthecobacter sp. TaxID=1965333 RepID=UPI00390336D6
MMDCSIYCPHCHKHTAPRMGGHQREGSYGSTVTVPAIADVHGHQWWIGICNSCQMPVLIHENGSTVYPSPQPSPTDPLIPESLADDLDEAKVCFTNECYQATAVMARRCIQRACVEKGGDPKKRLVDQIAALTSAGHITKDIEDWATVIRFIGNDGAHPGSDSVTDEEAEDCLKLAEQFLHVLFVTPALAQQRLAARNASKTK